MVSWYSLPSSKPEFLAKGGFFLLQVIWPCYRILRVCIVILSLELVWMPPGIVFLTANASNNRVWWIIWPKGEVCFHHSLELLQSPFWLWTPLRHSCLSCQQVYRPEQYSQVWNMPPLEPKGTYHMLGFLPSNGCKMLQIIVRWNNLTSNLKEVLWCPLDYKTPTHFHEVAGP